MENSFPNLAGECDVSADGHAIERVRCWLNIRQGTFDVEMPVELAGDCHERSILPRIENARFATSAGPLTAKKVVVAFAQHMGLRPAWSSNDLELDFLLDNAKQKPQWRFICNEPVKFHAPISGNCIEFFPGIDSPIAPLLSCGSQMYSTKAKTWINNSKDFSDKNIFALSLSVGGKLSFKYHHLMDEFCVFLQRQETISRPRPLFYCVSDSGHVDYQARAEGIAEVYRAALEYQISQSDGGKAFRLAVQAFIDANSRDLSFLLGALASFHCIEFFIPGATFNKQSVQHLGLNLKISEALCNLRNDIVHNNLKPDLHSSIMQCCDKFEKCGVDLVKFGDGARREYGLLSFLRSLAGCLILQKICANVVPVNFATDRHPFRIEDFK